MATATPEYPLHAAFKPAAEFFAAKVNLETRTWKDLWHGMHARAFVVAGATKADLLCDLRRAVADAVERGHSYDTFRKQFREIVARHGWAHTGSEGWRSRVIWQTNVRTAFAAGRYQQMMAVTDHMPWWLYDHTTLQHPREAHKAMDGKVWRFDNPVWDTIYPPNGWGCNCRVRPLSDRQLGKLGKTGEDPAPDPASVDVPPEWRYNVGQAAHGMPPIRKTADLSWEPMQQHAGFTTWDLEGLPERLPARPINARPLDDVPTPQAAADALAGRWGQRVQQFSFLDEKGMGYPVKLDADWIADHYKGELSRLPLLGYLEEVVKDPDEVWLSFERSRHSGMVVLRMQIIRQLPKGDDGRPMVAILNAYKGELLEWSFGPKKNKPSSLARTRQGRLLYSRYRPQK